MKKALSILLFVFSLWVPAFSQNPKVDEFERITCEELLARLDSLVSRVKANPDAEAYIILHPKRNSPAQATYYRNLILKTLQRQGQDLTRFNLYRGAESNEARGTFYVLQNGSEISEKGSLWLMEEPDLSKAFLFDSYGDDGVCPTFAPAVYAKLLKDNRSHTGKVIIHSSSRRTEREDARRWIETLTKDFAVPRKQIRITYGKRDIFHYAEFWILPPKK